MKQLKIHIVDDHPLVLKGMGKALASEGFVVVGTARDGDGAIAAIKSKGALPDLVLCDIRMLGSDKKN